MRAGIVVTSHRAFYFEVAFFRPVCTPVDVGKGRWGGLGM